ncbi:MAG: hypothetical protein IPI59_06595 [Sphingobacteriales bacterium]|nr:hypothetical protein [Sphingobacteriales bacterium]MBP9140998.1 hypothetical protein [Chitinophagales bacterium]MDA0198625.1 hypothetical protein [Bacteroidota bacterium]MBK6890263.1 hypothetical protein [Sphingobacteriales bacterium]MBK7527210.1 hypothetical protein [Sphingobacteriales bacterium]
MINLVLTTSKKLFETKTSLLTKKQSPQIMKSFSILGTFFCFALLVSGTSLQAQSPFNLDDISISNPPTGLCSKADLRFTTFTVQSIVKGKIVNSGAYRAYTVNFRATIINSGSSASTTCNLEPEYRRLGENNFFYAGCQSFAPLNAGASRVVEGSMGIRIPISENKAKIRLYIDSPCAEEHLPTYVYVSECDETNNYSKIVSINLP